MIIFIFKLKKMKLSTSDQIPGSSIDTTLGIARGSTVRTRNVGYDIKTHESYTKLQADAREQGMIGDARRNCSIVISYDGWSIRNFSLRYRSKA